MFLVSLLYYIYTQNNRAALKHFLLLLGTFYIINFYNYYNQMIFVRSVNASNLEKFQLKIAQHELYEDGEPLVEALLKDMATQPVLHAGNLNSNLLEVTVASLLHIVMYFCT